MKLRIGTRGSELALAQTRTVSQQLLHAHPDLMLEEVILKPAGDVDRSTPLKSQGSVGLFTKELERALLAEEIDVAVHSLKDLPTQLPEGLELAAIPKRESPWDVWISEEVPGLVDLPEGARVATGSPRRRAQILHSFPHLKVVGIRGNIDTRLASYPKHAAGLVLAAAGLVRIGRQQAIRAFFGPTEMTPAPGQGALGLEVRADHNSARELLASLTHRPTQSAVTGERILLSRLEGGCSLPIGALGQVRGDRLALLGMIADHDGKRLLRLSVEGSAADPEALGVDLAEKLRRAGGDEILRDLRPKESG
ncbi:MAG: hydroxymethylbilane synthase [Planctomycetota bacterium]